MRDAGRCSRLWFDIVQGKSPGQTYFVLDHGIEPIVHHAIGQSYPNCWWAEFLHEHDHRIPLAIRRPDVRWIALVSVNPKFPLCVCAFFARCSPVKLCLFFWTVEMLMWGLRKQPVDNYWHSEWIKHNFAREFFVVWHLPCVRFVVVNMSSQLTADSISDHTQLSSLTLQQTNK